jgi:hypothetical protein
MTMTSNDDDSSAGEQQQLEALNAIAGIVSSGSEPSVQRQETNDTTGTNPWNVSPAVTCSNSELSSASSRKVNEPGGSGTFTDAAVVMPAPWQQEQQQSEQIQPQQESHQLSAFATATVTSDSPPVQVPAVRSFLSSGGDEQEAPPTPSKEQPQLQLIIDTTPASILLGANSGSPTTDYQEGGRLWQAALVEASITQKHSNKASRSRFAESIMERTRSRADPNALTPNSTGIISHMVSLGDHESSYILSSALAKKRVRVVQLLLIGLIGLLLGLLGNFFVSTSCHFATVHIGVGQHAGGDGTFEFHFGLWKYSPIDSVFQGYSYCFRYDQNYATEAPVLPRACNVAALIAGLIAITILWLYLIFGTTTPRRWKWAVRFAIIAAVVQAATVLLFFVPIGSDTISTSLATTICHDYSCDLGPGAYLAILTSVVWLVLACEMQYHMPVAQYADGALKVEEPQNLVATMEMTHCVDDVTREYVTRVTGKTKDDELPALHHLRRSPVRPTGFYSPNSLGSGILFPTSPAARRGPYQAPPYHEQTRIVEEGQQGVPA